QFPDGAFLGGRAQAAGLLGAPVEAKHNPVGWVVGGPNRYPDVLLLVASDSRQALRDEVARLKQEMETIQGGSVRGRARRGLRLIYEEEGENLPGRLAGHEHFGFKDGVSQPGVRGRVSSAPLDFLPPRLIAPRDPLALTHARPGQPLVWPGHFLLGDKYPVQTQDAPTVPQPNDPATPAWAANGS